MFNMDRDNVNHCDRRSGNYAECEGKGHRYEASITSAGNLMITVYTEVTCRDCQYLENDYCRIHQPNGPSGWDVAARVVNPSPKELQDLFNHAFEAGMDHKGD
jgi:hypothetical protein